jgi:hypothetical protein
MENNVALVDPKWKISCPVGNKFDREAGMIFAKAITMMSLAKNIRLAEGTIGAWEQCLIEDLRSGVMEFEDFILATKRVIRSKLFNRIDYADIFEEATIICDKRRRRTPNFPALDDGVPMPAEVKEALANFKVKGME